MAPTTEEKVRVVCVIVCVFWWVGKNCIKRIEIAAI